MGSFGERMRREREMRGITLDAISESTKITTRSLEALENDEFDKLPGGIFNKGFVRSYARFLGMNEEQVLKDFIEVAGDPEQPLPDPPVKHQEIPPLKERRSRGGIAGAIVASALVAAGLWYLGPALQRLAGAAWMRVHKGSSQPINSSSVAFAADNAAATSTDQNQPAPAPSTPAQVDAAIVQPAAQTSSTAPELVPAAATTHADKFVILVKANRPTWVSITADGQPVLEGILKRKKKVHAYSQVVLKTKNAGALTVARNGKPLPPIGNEDQQTTVTFTPDGVTR